MMSGKYHQHGIALITVLLILAIATVAVVSMSTSRQMDIRRTENQLQQIQAWEYVYAIESWAKGRLQADVLDTKSHRSQDSWSQPLTETAVMRGGMQAQIQDLQSRINLNNIWFENKVSELDVQRLKRLFVQLSLNPKLVDALVDWIDPDMEIRYPDGAEDETYTRQKPPYRAANRAFADVSELLLVQGFSREIYEKILPYVYVVNTYAPINVNTAKPVILRCLADDISADQSESIFRASGKPFANLADFLRDEAVIKTGIVKNGLTVNSQQFLISGEIEISRNRWLFFTQFSRDNHGYSQLIKRQRRRLVNG